jgi:hypothetical protein
LANLPLSNSALLMVLGLLSFFFTWLPAAHSQESEKKLPVAAPATSGGASFLNAKDLSSPQSILTIYINDLNLPGWQPQPFYMWTQGSAPAAPAAPTAPASASASTVSATAAAVQAVPSPGKPEGFPATEAGPRALHSPLPCLPDGDSAREAILAEYRLTGFFRKTFQRGQRYIYIDIYDFQSADGAYGAYNYLRRGSTTVLPRGDVASEDDNSISFVQGKTFLSIYATSHDDDESKEVLTKVAGQAVQYVGGKGTEPNILNRLPQLDLVHGSEKIVMGPNSVKRFFPAPYASSLALENGRAVGCVGDYQIQEPAKERLKLMVLAFKTPGDALASYQNFLTQIGVARNDDVSSMIHQPINVFKTGGTYLAIEQRGADLLMIIGARKRFSPALVLRQVR